MKRIKQSYLLISIVFILSFSISINAVSAQTEPNILVLSESIEQEVKERFQLETKFEISFANSIALDLNNYDGIVLYDYQPTIIEYSQILDYQGGICIYIGSNLLKNTSILFDLNLISSGDGTILNGSVLPEVVEANSGQTIIKEIQWNSVVKVYNFTNLNLEGNILLETSSESDNPNIPLIGLKEESKHLTVNFLPTVQNNSEFIQWPYFNYFLYLTIMTITQNEPLSFAKWPYSPVPHINSTIFLGISVLVTLAITIFCFIYSRKYSNNNPIDEKDLEEMSKEVKEDKEWEAVGMHRQLAGFFVQLFIGLLIILPNVVMSALVFPLLILPSPQAAGFYDFTIRFFEALWLFFDIGTSIVLVKFFSQHRVNRPQHAVKYIQIFIWYQMLSGVLQLFLISFLGSFIFPRTFLAHLSWIFVTHAFFQWPAFFIVFMLIFQAMNRHDLYQILNLLLYAVLNITLQYGVIVLFRFTLGKNPIFGDGLAGAIGYSVGNYAIQITTFLVGLALFKKQGFSLKSIFRVDFTMEEIKESLRFGLKWMVGKILPPLGWFIQLFLLSWFLPNYTEQQGFFSIAWNFALIVMLAGLFANSILPGVSESYHAKKKNLTRYYALNSLKWSAYFDWFFVSALLAIGPRFIRGGAGVEWEGAAILIPWMLLFHFFGYPSWLGDWMFAGSDRPGWAAISWVLEQIIRAALLFAFVPSYKFFTSTFNSPMVSVMFAYIPALVIKNAFMWYFIRRDDYFKFPWSDFLYQGIIAPLITAGAVYGILELLFQVIWQGEIITSVAILLIGILPGLYLHAFIAGLFGTFDDNTLKEYERSVNMVKGLGFMAKPMYKLTEWGAKISPLHNRFPITIYEEAMKEADEITNEKEKLVL